MDIGALSARYEIALQLQAGAAPCCCAQVGADDWSRVAAVMRAEGSRLLAIWGSDRRAVEQSLVISAAYCVPEGLLWLRLAVAEHDGYPDLSSTFPAARRMQRAAFELIGLRASAAFDTRPWINHGRWPADYFPLQQQHSGKEQFNDELANYPFVTVAGDGVHEIAVGPIHAGTIEPGHFRFSVVGEKVLRLEQHFGYTHKGIDKLFAGRELREGHRLAGRVSGDSSVAFAWAYCMAAEAATGCQIPPRAAWLRALLLERERVANHLGDLGALGNDAGLALGLAQFSVLKEQWVRLNEQSFGHRYLFDCIVPGGTGVDLDAAGIDAMLRQCDTIGASVTQLRHIYEGHAGLQDRLIGTGRVAPQLAAELGLCGMAGRASGQPFDARADQASAPYEVLKVRMATHSHGDVAARVTMRFEEIVESLRLLREIVQQLESGPIAVPLPCGPGPQAFGVGWIEGWRGPVFVALECDPSGTILRCHCHDPSWQNWPVIEHAIMGNIVADFPLINKSFNLSYSGADL